MGVHAIDTVRFLMGDPHPVGVWASAGRYYQDDDVEYESSRTGQVVMLAEN